MADECKTLIDDFSLALTLFTKFDELWKKIGIRNREKDCEGRIKQVAWLIFITAKGIFFL